MVDVSIAIDQVAGTFAALLKYARPLLLVFCLTISVGANVSSAQNADPPHESLEIINRILPSLEFLRHLSEKEAPTRDDAFLALLVACNLHQDISDDEKYSDTIAWIVEYWEENFFTEEVQVNIKEDESFKDFLREEKDILINMGLSQGAWDRLESLFIEYRYNILDFDPNLTENRFFLFDQDPEICLEIENVRQILANQESEFQGSDAQKELIDSRHEVIGRTAACFLGAFAVAGDVPAFAWGLFGVAVTSTSFGIFFVQVFCPSFEEFWSIF